MSLERHYERPPLVEALCEVYFAGSQWDPTVPGLFFQRIRDEFPNRQLMQEVAIPPVARAALPSDSLATGTGRMQFLGGSAHRIVQLAKDLLVVNQLPPYPGFKEWCPVATRLASIYCELARPQRIERLGLRYINRVVVPRTSFRVSEYLGVFATVPEKLGGEKQSFLLRVEVPAVFPAHKLLITVSSEPLLEPGPAELMLDLYDSADAGDDVSVDTIESMLRAGHENLVYAFENSITDASRQLFGEEGEVVRGPIA